MEAHGVRPQQVAQVRGFADRQLRHPEDPEHASNRRISVIVQYLTPPVAAGKVPGEPAKAAGEPAKAAGEPAKAPGEPAKAAGEAGKAAGEPPKGPGR
jgi:chemotaxis protein MotB